MLHDADAVPIHCTVFGGAEFVQGKAQPRTEVRTYGFVLPPAGWFVGSFDIDHSQRYLGFGCSGNQNNRHGWWLLETLDAKLKQEKLKFIAFESHLSESVNGFAP